MDDKYKRLYKLTKRMRIEQKGFFASKPGTKAKENYLYTSKNAEKQVDQLLIDIECGQEEIF